LIIKINLDNKIPENPTNEPVEENENNDGNLKFISFFLSLFSIFIYLEVPNEEQFDDET
jgi:hypothetical protein